MSSQALFVSHASEDAQAVDKIVEYLERNGVTCWISSRDIPARAIYAEAITRGMSEAQACAVIVSQHANTSDAIKRELELASRHRKPFIPIRIDGVEPGPGLDYYLNNTQWIDMRREGDRALDRIVRSMGADAPATHAPQALASAPPPRVARAEDDAPPRGNRLGPIVASVVSALLVVGVGLGVMSMTGGGKAPGAVAPALVDQGRASMEAEAAAARAERDAALQRADNAEQARADAQARADQVRADAQARADQAARGPSVPGAWNGTLSWVGARVFNFTFNSDGTFTMDDGNSGKWTQNGDQLTLVTRYDTKYTGYISNGVYSGSARGKDGSNYGTFRIQRGYAAAAAPAPAVSAGVGKWTGKISADKDPFTYTLLADGSWTRINTTTKESSVRAGSWTLSGNRLVLNEKTGMKWDGTLSGDTYSGTVYWENGDVLGSFTVTRD